MRVSTIQRKLDAAEIRNLKNKKKKKNKKHGSGADDDDEEDDEEDDDDDNGNDNSGREHKDNFKVSEYRNLMKLTPFAYKRGEGRKQRRDNKEGGLVGIRPDSASIHV